MLILKLALRNIMSAGLRTWLNILVLSLVLVLIIWVQGLISGMRDYAMTTRIDSELGGGQYWHSAYDPYDPFTYEESHAPLPPALERLVAAGEATPVLITTGAIYPEGRMQGTVLKGIDPSQRIVNLPTSSLAGAGEDGIPALVGAQMAKRAGLGIGDLVTVRWRDAAGTFDADDIRIVQIMNTTVPTVDAGQIWVPIDMLRAMLGLPGEASIVVLAKEPGPLPPSTETWIHHGLDFLLKDLIDLIEFRSATTKVIHSLLLFMGLLAVFDTQVLAIWRRRKEIGTLMALGMERAEVMGLFTLEGALHGLLAIFMGAAYGIPVLYWTLVKGLPMPEMTGDFGIAVPDVLRPTYGTGLVAGTVALLVCAVTVVSFIPVSRIARLSPTDALRGKAR